MKTPALIIVTFVFFWLTGCELDPELRCADPVGECRIEKQCVATDGPDVYSPKTTRVIEGATEAYCRRRAERESVCQQQPCCYSRFKSFTPLGCPGDYDSYTPDTQVTVGVGVSGASTGYGDTITEGAR